MNKLKENLKKEEGKGRDQAKKLEADKSNLQQEIYQLKDSVRKEHDKNQELANELKKKSKVCIFQIFHKFLGML